MSGGNCQEAESGPVGTHYSAMITTCSKNLIHFHSRLHNSIYEEENSP